MKKLLKKSRLMSCLTVYLNNQNRDFTKPTKYINNYTGEITNHPLLESFRTYINLNWPLKDALKHLFSWKKEIH